MPTDAEAQFSHIAEREGLPSLTLPVNGDPVNPEVLDNFAFEIHARFRRKHAAAGIGPADHPWMRGGAKIPPGATAGLAVRISEHGRDAHATLAAAAVHGSSVVVSLTE